MAFIYYVNNDLFYFKANFIFAIKSSLINFKKYAKNDITCKYFFINLIAF